MIQHGCLRNAELVPVYYDMQRYTSVQSVDG